MRILISLVALLAGLVNAGCQANSLDTAAPSEFVSSPSGTSLSTPSPDSSNQEITTPDRIGEQMAYPPERVPPTEIITHVTGEVPAELLDSILKDLADRTGADPEIIAVIQAQAMVWNDGSLGCAKAGEFYIQALVNGYHVVLEVEGQKYDYRAADTGYFYLCEGGFRPNRPPGTPNS